MAIKWEGVMPAVTTKFDENDELDLNTFEKNINAQLEAGVSGIILGGTLGEASTLTPKEKENLVKKTLEVVNGKVPVIINIAEQSTKDAIQVAQDAFAWGAQGLMLLPPMRYKATDRETVVYLKEIAKSTSLPIMIYNNPVDYKIEVSLEMFEELLAECDNIEAVKESTRDISNVIRLKNKFGDRLKVLCGVDTLALESMVSGADGWVAGLVAAYPEETVAIYKLVKAGELKEALKIYSWFMPLLELDISPQLVQNIKLAEVATGLGTENVRAPRLQLEGAERKRVLTIIDDAMAKRPTLVDYKSL
ncbi:4-hydroxy-tetrahydrodipicolinate synthase [Salegentibacter salinarum]|uniref:4-hydroxy-tetrahydrodipicolinate synthase n=1 Tax=Salegentibacter salinarum TaxID=447422 RepID=A0A2N0U429_9FLAO|nr:dihydrodipicolinate synthase family protein [Salegentibacter salinarum]PKD21781.1 4-hydroxy-tetrahydrodipicolinate synthase [Salegentibacter salinarum]SKB33685.1 4-hydroxy-tetrahydrodipicolinate synthase [Salegentibacter salinarum]